MRGRWGAASPGLRSWQLSQAGTKYKVYMYKEMGRGRIFCAHCVYFWHDALSQNKDIEEVARYKKYEGLLFWHQLYKRTKKQWQLVGIVGLNGSPFWPDLPGLPGRQEPRPPTQQRALLSYIITIKKWFFLKMLPTSHEKFYFYFQYAP